MKRQQAGVSVCSDGRQSGYREIDNPKESGRQHSRE